MSAHNTNTLQIKGTFKYILQIFILLNVIKGKTIHITGIILSHALTDNNNELFPFLCQYRIHTTTYRSYIRDPLLTIIFVPYILHN